MVMPDDKHYRDIATLAVDSMAKLDRNSLIHDTATGKVDVASAITLAEQVSGLTAPAPAAERPSPDEWNTL
jgi:hypothetical protein